jgi:hypothetical protein
VLEAACERVIPRDDRWPERRVPMAPFVDESLAEADTDGFRMPDVPWAGELWRVGLRGLDEASRERYGCGFAQLAAAARDEVLCSVEQGEVAGGAWESLPPTKFFKQLVQEVIAAYYAHPTAWAKIGWDGPASPRGYIRTGYGIRDPWEPDERGAASSVAVVRSSAP